jgi:hypothetical protein
VRGFINGASRRSSGLLSGHILVEDVPRQGPEAHSVHASGRDRPGKDEGIARRESMGFGWL